MALLPVEHALPELLPQMLPRVLQTVSAVLEARMQPRHRAPSASFVISVTLPPTLLSTWTALVLVPVQRFALLARLECSMLYRAVLAICVPLVSTHRLSAHPRLIRVPRVHWGGFGPQSLSVEILTQPVRTQLAQSKHTAALQLDTAMLAAKEASQPIPPRILVVLELRQVHCFAVHVRLDWWVMVVTSAAHQHKPAQTQMQCCLWL